MGCVNSSHAAEASTNRVRKPKPWKHNDRTISMSQLNEMRTLFWRQAPSSGGRAVIWEGLEEAAGCDDLHYRQAILDTNNITLGNPDMTLCFDDAGNRYELPLYVLSNPTNLNRDTRNIMRRITDRFRER